MKPWPSPHKRKSVVTSGARINNGRGLASQAARWMESHEESFWKICGFCKTVKGGRLRDRVALYCLDNGISVGPKPRAFGNDYWAGIARYIVLVDPTLEDNPIKMEDSDIDCYGLVPVSYLKGKIHD